MNIFYFDHTLQGLLCAIFDAYKIKCFPDLLLAEGEIGPLIVDTTHTVETMSYKYQRVSQALKKKLSPFALTQIRYIWHAETPESKMLLFRYLCKVLESAKNIEKHYSDPDILAVKKLAKKVSAERHYLMMFVRFNKTADDIYFAPVAPRYNVLPFIYRHFQQRFADQKWIIYDESRHYGYFFNGETIEEMTLLDNKDFLINNKINATYLAEDEPQFTALWQKYIQALTIRERINPKLQKRAMPTRFWKYLPETWTK